MAYLTINFESEYLNNNHEVSIILPDKPRGITAHDFYGSGKKYKVLWLLHGTYGDHSDWIRKSNIELYACEKDLIVVMPSGMNANYANWEKFSIGYNRAGRIMDQLERLGIVGPAQGSKARDVLCMDETDLQMRLSNLQS